MTTRPPFGPLDDEIDDVPAEPFDDSEEESSEPFDPLSEPPETNQPALALEPIFSLLLKQAIEPGDHVLRDYAAHVVPRLSAHLGHVAAKGGDFVQQKLAEGLSAAEVARYAHDQSMRAHLLNGLLPVARFARTLRAWGVGRFSADFDEDAYRLFCAGFTLHDWLKLPEVDAELGAAGLQHHTVNPAVHLPIIERIIARWCAELGLERFLEPLGPLQQTLHDLIYIASNTQLRWGTMHNLTALPGLSIQRRRSTLLATDLATLADYLAYLGRSPVDAVRHPRIGAMVESFAERSTPIRLTYHHLSDVRGVLTNIINNAALEAYQIPDQRVPLLYAPTGVVYLSRSAAPAPDPAAVAEAAVARIRRLCQGRLRSELIGFERDGKGLKYADYYELFFTPAELARLAARAAEKRISKESVAGKRYDSIAAKGMAPAGLDLDLPRSIEVDRLAETCAALVKIAAAHAPAFDAEGWLVERLGVAEAREQVRALNGHKTAGGVPYGWYYAAGRCRDQAPGWDEPRWLAQLGELAEGLAAHLPATPAAADGWADLQRYVADHLRFAESAPDQVAARAAAELARYRGAGKSGRGASTVCSLCSSAYSISEQREAAILFAPQVYTNKQPLHSSKAIRHICAVCGAEMMLRQLLMKRGRETGGKFEKRRLRYLFFYPTYFYTPETLRMLRLLQDRLRRVSFTTLRKLLLPEDRLGPALDPQTFQQLESVLLHADEMIRPEDDPLLRQRYEEREAITFSFIGLPPPGREAKDAEAWIQPAFLALVLPLALDIKVVASESMLPLFSEAAELPETVAFDAAHAFVGYLTARPGQSGRASPPGRLNLDEVLPALQRLSAAYLIHLDGNAQSGAGGYDYRWPAVPALARALATSPLYAFHYLKRWQRREGQDSYGPRRAALYLELVRYLAPQGDADMTHAQRLTEIYRRFYRAEKFNSNAILRPLSVGAQAILEADPRLFDSDDALAEAVRGRLRSFVENVASNRADGRLPRGSDHASREAAVAEFSTYLVHEIYRKTFGGDRAALRGTQLNLLKNACEALYLDAQRRERGEPDAAQTDPADQTE